MVTRKAWETLIYIYIYIYVGSYVNELLYTRVNEHKQQINIQREGVEVGGGGGEYIKKNKLLLSVME